MGGRVVGRRGDRAGRDFLMMGHRWRKRARCEGALTAGIVVHGLLKREALYTLSTSQNF